MNELTTVSKSEQLEIAAAMGMGGVLLMLLLTDYLN